MNGKETAILIVDDDKETGPITRTFLEACLKTEHNCVIATSAEEAMKLCEASFFHLVLTDIQLPKASGLDLCRFIHQTQPNTVVIMISGMTDINYAIEAMRNGAFDYLVKPVNPKEFISTIERAIEYQSALMAKYYCEESLREEVNDLAAINERLRSLEQSVQLKRQAAKIQSR
ncbi:MAG TPA: response regulator [Blastocatellia bacterium]|nr:response regulator [Blastocatellia bacterium]